MLYEVFAPVEAWRIAPKHGSWLNIAASEFAALAAQCLNRHIESEAGLQTAIGAWVRDRNALGKPVNWQLPTEDSRIKPLHLHPTFE